MEVTKFGDIEPVVIVKLNKNETFIAESDAMVMRDASVDIEGQMNNSNRGFGGFLGAVTGRVLNNETLFRQKFVCQGSEGQVVLAPPTPGDVYIIPMDNTKRIKINDGSFLASSESINLDTTLNSGWGNAFFGGSGGLFVTSAQGIGDLVIHSMGNIMELEVTPDKPIIVDNFHLIAWDDTLTIEASLTQKKSFLSNVVNSVTTGEGITLKLSGSGTAYISTRNKMSFIDYVSSMMNRTKG